MAANDITPPGRATIDRLACSVYPPMAMLAGMQLDVFTPLKDGPMTPEALAPLLGADAAKLRPVLYALVAAGLLTVEEGAFSNTSEANYYLVRGSPRHIGAVHEIYADLWQAAMRTAESIRTRVPQAKHDFTAISPAELKAFFAGLDSGARAAGRGIAETYDLSRCRHLLDVGGGSGGLALAACSQCPELSATVLELPHVAPVARQFVAEAGLSDRVRVIAGDIVQGPPQGSYDAATMRAFIQVLSAEQARLAIRHVGQAMAPGGLLFIVGRMLDDSRLSPPETVAFNLVFLNLYDEGQAYTEGEHRQWLAAAGFVDVERHVQPDEISVLTARKA